MFELFPDPRELDNAPELAALVILEAALQMVIAAMRSAHPGLDDPERPYWLRCARPEAVAHRIVTRAGALSRTVRHYRAALRTESPPPPRDLDRSSPPLTDSDF